MPDNPPEDRMVPLNSDELQALKLGDSVHQVVAGLKHTQSLIVSAIGPDTIWCGTHQFSRKSGKEITQGTGWTEENSPAFLAKLNGKPEKVYMIVLEDSDEDQYVGLVRQEIYDWIVTEPEGDLMLELRTRGSAYDTTTPESLREELRKTENSHGMARMTIGSYENDKAIFGRHATLCPECSDPKEIFAWLRNHREYQLEDTYNGYHY